MICVHHLENSRSQRVLWLLEELEIPYEIKRYARDRRTMLAPPELRAVHPLGKAPVVTDGGLTLAETGAIVEHLVETHGGRLGPAEVPELRWLWRHFLHHAEGSAMPPLVMSLVFSQIEKQAPALIRPLLKGVFRKVNASFLGPQLATNADYWEAALAATGWFAGPDFSAADVMMSFPLETAAQRVGFERRPNCRGFIERIHARPAYRRALERGGPYAYA